MVDKNVSWDDIKDSYEDNRIKVTDGDDFIEVYDGALSKDICDRLIEEFEQLDARGACQAGGSSSHVDKSLKDSTDLIVDGHFMNDPANAGFRNLLQPVVTCLSEYAVKYLTKYHCLLPDVMPGPNNEIILHDEILASPQLAMQAMQSAFSIQTLQMQRYKPPGQGYHAWHYEARGQSTLARVLFPIIYLNDVDSGGETEFYYWDAEVKPRAGRLVIAPGGFTHTHRMKVGPVSNAKYILTTWYVARG